MFGTLRIGTWFGIPVKLHFSLALLPVLTYSFLERFGPWHWLLFEVMLFASIVVHEFGHALVGRRYGVKTYDIVLTPLGGMARMLDMPTSPKQEIAIALAGPLASLGLSVLSFAAAVVLALSPFASSQRLELMEWIWSVNLGLGLFNLTPALPMDGGRVLRGLLALRYDHLTATRRAAAVGKVIAGAGAVFAFLYGLMVPALIAIFIYFSAGAEVRMAQWREAQKAAAAKANEGPFTYRPRVWTWPRPQTGTGTRPSEPPPDWHQPRASRDVVVIEGGKAEIVGRGEPKS